MYFSIQKCVNLPLFRGIANANGLKITVKNILKNVEMWKYFETEKKCKICKFTSSPLKLC